MAEGRLTEEEVTGLTDKLTNYDAELILKTGFSLREIALRSAEINEKKVKKAINSKKVAVIRITSGLGIIENFTEAIKGILNYIGSDVFITKESDVAGLAEGLEKACDIAFLADDKRFVAINFPLKKVIDNAEATAAGYVFALDAMVKGLKQREVLVIGGAGRVGWNAVIFLKKRGAKVAVFEPVQDKARSLFRGYNICLESNLDEALKRYKLVFDASPAKDIIQLRHITPETFIAAPGRPIGLTEEALPAIKKRLIHDVLQIGVSVMLIMAVNK